MIPLQASATVTSGAAITATTEVRLARYLARTPCVLSSSAWPSGMANRLVLPTF